MSIFREILTRFPRGNLTYAFAYGSGVKQQLGYDLIDKQQQQQQQQKNVIDMIFCVKDPLGWHAENIERHPNHYSAMKLLGPAVIMKYQENYGAGVYFNTLVPLEDMNVTIKYGVITRDQLLDDLRNWRYLYLAGRLQKPVQDVVDPAYDTELSEALQRNLRLALQVSLLMLPERFSAYKLFHTIANLSYKGDFRMIFGENKQKVRNIVKAQEHEFLKLYEPAMINLVDYIAVDYNAKVLGESKPVVLFEQDKSKDATEFHLRQVPKELKKRLVRNAAFRGSYAEITPQLAIASNLSEIVQVSVQDIVWRSSISQSLKNIASAGLMKTLTYAYRKALKTFSK